MWRSDDIYWKAIFVRGSRYFFINLHFPFLPFCCFILNSVSTFLILRSFHSAFTLSTALLLFMKFGRIKNEGAFGVWKWLLLPDNLKLMSINIWSPCWSWIMSYINHRDFFLLRSLSGASANRRQHSNAFLARVIFHEKHVTEINACRTKGSENLRDIYTPLFTLSAKSKSAFWRGNAALAEFNQDHLYKSQSQPTCAISE